MKALVIAPQPFFSPRGTPFSVYYRTLITSELGVDIDLITYGEGQDVEIPNVKIIRIPRFKFLGNVKIGPSFLKLFLDIFIILKTIYCLATKRYDFVHAHEEAVFFCRFLKPFFRFKLIYDMHSSLPQQLTNFKFTTSSKLISIFKRLEDTCLNNSDAIITICPDLANYVNNLIRDPNRHFLIENSIFEQVRIKKNHTTNTNENNEVLPFEIPRNKSIILYAGTLEAYQGIEILIQSFPTIIKKEPDAFLLIVGGSTEQVKKYKKLSRDAGTDNNCFFTGRVQQKLAKYYTSKASVLTSPRSSGTNTPLKIYEQLASGIPLVATNIYSHTQVLCDDVAFMVNPTPEDMARGILNALSDDGKKVAQKAQSLYESKYSRPIYEKKMKQLLGLIA